MLGFGVNGVGFNGVYVQVLGFWVQVGITTADGQNPALP